MDEDHINDENTAQESEDLDSDDSSEDIEPRLKYTRMVNDVKEILETAESVSCVGIHPKFICMGTSWGNIFIFDHQGNLVRTELKVHTVAVNQISIDAKGDFIASCADDGNISVFGLYSSDNKHHFKIGRLVRSIAIDPMYYKAGSGRRFIIGDERLVLYEKTLFSRLKTTVLGDASIEGGIKNIKWSPGGELLAWATHFGFRVYAFGSQTSLGLVKWASKPKVDMKCHICWKGNHTLIVGWYDTIKVCAVKTRNMSSDGSLYILQPVYTFKMDYIVCGVGPLDGNLVVLGFVQNSNGLAQEGEKPQLQVIQPDSEGYIDLGMDTLLLAKYDKCTAANYSLECLIEEGRFVIVSPWDLAIACPYDSDDRMDWLIKHNKFEVAFKAVAQQNAHYVRHSEYTVREAYIKYLFDIKKDYKMAADECKILFGDDKMKWDLQIRRFAEVQQLTTIADYLPVSEDNKLPPHNYELVLSEYLKTDPKGFLKKIKTWSPKLYNVSTIGNAVMQNILDRGSESQSNPDLMEALAFIYSLLGNHDKALSMYIKLQNKGVFDLIKQQKLYKVIHTTAMSLMALDSEQAVETMVESKDVKPDEIVKALETNSYYLYLYLDRFNQRCTEKCRPYHSLMIKLYAEHAKDKLLRFLRGSDYYALEEALNICNEKHFHEGTVYLLGRIGNTKEALSIILSKLKDIERAISFCKERDEQDLWDDLIAYSLDKAEFITKLLEHTATYVDPSIIIQRISSKTEIPNLKEALGKMMRGYSLQVEIQEESKNILASDYYDLNKKVIAIRQKGVLVGDKQVCGKCTKQLGYKYMKDEVERGIIIFHCSHIFHSYCLPKDCKNCIICVATHPLFK